MDLVLLDLDLEDSAGLATFEKVQELDPHLPIIILTSDDDETQSVTAVRNGAQDYLVKWRFDSESLARSIHFTLERATWARHGAGIQSSQRLYVARSIQQDILPQEQASIPGVDLHGRCEVGEIVAGDFFDYMPMLRENWGIAIGSMVGNGLRAVMKMVELRAVMRSLVLTHGDVSYIVSRACHVVAPDLQLSESIHLGFVRIDPKDLSIQYLGTEEQGVVLDRRGEVKHRLQPTIAPVRADITDDTLITETLAVEPGDVMLLWSRGVNECRAADGSRFGTPELSQSIADHLDSPPKVLVEMLYQEIYRLCDTHQLDHDVSIVVARFSGEAGKDPGAWSI